MALHLDRFLRGFVVYGAGLWSGSSLIEGASTRWALYLRTAALASSWGPRYGQPVVWLTYLGGLGIGFVCVLVWWASLGVK